MKDKEKQIICEYDNYYHAEEIKQTFKKHEEKQKLTFEQECWLIANGEDLPKDNKQIKEMVKEIFNTCAWRFSNPNDYKEVFNDIAEDLTKLNYRKLPEDSVVLSKSELEEIKNIEKKYYKKVVIPQARKETAEKFYEFAKAWFEYDEQNDYFEEVKELAKQFGVEIKE